ncbi:atlastin-1-like isoform X2 [Clavelina lepadiformis]|uniref:atlastin-1-like isoform X2 n=1 Tax=Clavelina lepadiformis TaxID=159417 RepID=UPI004042135A
MTNKSLSSGKDEFDISTISITEDISAIEDGPPVSVQILKPRENTNGFELIEEGLYKIFNHPNVIDVPVIIISIAGAMREGKSFLLSLLLMYMESDMSADWLSDKNKEIKQHFKFKSGHERQTLGVHIWSKPYLLTRKDKSKVAVLFMDTQGAFDRAGAQNASSIFAFSTFLSSTQLYNMKRQIHENNLQPLSLFADYAAEVYNSMPGREENSAPFQKILFTVRDWQTSKQGYGLKAGQDYIDCTVFKTDNTDKSDIVATRERIRKAFQKIECSVLPSPGKVVAGHVNNAGSAIKVKDVRPKFLTAVKELATYLIDEMNSVRSISGKELIGRDFPNYVAKLHELLEREQFLEPLAVIEAYTKAMAQNKINELVQEYNREMEEQRRDFMRKTPFRELHDKLKSNLLGRFKSEFSTEYDSIKDEFLRNLTNEIDNGYSIHEQGRTFEENRFDREGRRSLLASFNFYRKKRQNGVHQETAYHAAMENYENQICNTNPLKEELKKSLESLIKLYGLFPTWLQSYRDNMEAQIKDGKEKIYELHEKEKKLAINRLSIAVKQEENVPQPEQLENLERDLLQNVKEEYERIQKKINVQDKVTPKLEEARKNSLSVYKEHMKAKEKEIDDVSILTRFHKEYEDVVLAKFKEKTTEFISPDENIAKEYNVTLGSLIRSVYESLAEAKRMEKNREGEMHKNKVKNSTETVFEADEYDFVTQMYYQTILQKYSKYMWKKMEEEYRSFAAKVKPRKGVYRESSYFVLAYARVLLSKIRLPIIESTEL